MTKILNSKNTILLLVTLSLQISNIAAISCDKYNITHILQDDTITINFSTNYLLKFNRKVQCTSNSSWISIDGCACHCPELGYGQFGDVFVEMQHDNGTNETCFIKYTTPLQAPSLAFINVTGYEVRLGINRPKDSFDYVIVHCSDEKSHIIFNTSTSFNNSMMTVDCSFIDTSLMSFLLETVKKDFVSATNHIIQEVPLPVPFNCSVDNSLLLAVRAEPPPTINIPSTYEFQLIFYDKNNDSISYERAKFSNLIPSLGADFSYRLIPNLTHTIIFKHIVNSIGYAQSNQTITPISNISYPYEVKNLRVQEEFNNVIVRWDDDHFFDDPIEFIVYCNSSQNSMKKVGRNTTYMCEQMTLDQTDMISVETRITVAGYTHDRIPVVKINTSQIPEIPTFEVFNQTENSITIRWNYSSINTSFEFKIKCGLNDTSTKIDILSNMHQCQSLDQGTLYVITMLVENMDNTIQRSKSIHANTLLGKCQYKNHFYVSDLNDTRAVIIEWSPPEKNFDKIYVDCPSGLITFEYYQVMPIMYVKCIVTPGVQYTVTFSTAKSGYERASIQFTHTPPIDPTTTTITTTTPVITTTITTTTPVTTTTITTTTPVTTTTITTTTPVTTTTPPGTTQPPATTTTTPPPGTTQRPLITTTTTPPGTTRPSVTTATTTESSDCLPDELAKSQIGLARWRTAAIVAFIIAGFLILAIICLTVLSVFLHLRNRYNVNDE